MTTTVHDVKQRIVQAMAAESDRIGRGGCTHPDFSASQVAMEYRERIGYVMGLHAALDLIEELEREGS